jgi:hypothetical protein
MNKAVGLSLCQAGDADQGIVRYATRLANEVIGRRQLANRDCRRKLAAKEEANESGPGKAILQHIHHQEYRGNVSRWHMLS